MKIAILGGTGPEGQGLGMRWAAAGHEVLVGSRDAERGAQAAAEMNGLLPASAATVRGSNNLAVAESAEVIVLSVPYKAQEPTLASVASALQGKLLITVVAPLQPPKVSHVWLPPAGSAAQEAQQQLGEDVTFVAAFQNISAVLLKELDQDVDSDVLICGDDQPGKEVAAELARAAGLRPIDSGPLQNASVVEGLTAILIGINKRNKIKHSGIRITGLPDGA
ncbi:MAG: NADPH-dependent F420 reductase [Anaerolineae bacterium]|nr:NADPH-dependent F420 reductase [Anaerolineae bacterium]